MAIRTGANTERRVSRLDGKKQAVVVMACDDEILPPQSRIEAVVDEAELYEIDAGTQVLK